MVKKSINNNYPEKITFLYNSINDIQAIIRSIDTKLHVIIVFLMFPLTKLDYIYFHVDKFLKSQNPVFARIFIMLFVLLWVLAFISTFRGLSSIDSSARHIKGQKPSGIYFAGELFQFSIWDSLFNRKKIYSKKNIKNILEKLPTNNKDLLEELVYEQTKLCFIRDIKMIRQKYAYFFLLCWLLMGGLIWFFSI